MHPVLFIIVNLLLAFACMSVAMRKGRRTGLWFVLGMLFGWIALLIVLLMPKVDPEVAPVKTADTGPTIDVAVEEIQDPAPIDVDTQWFYLDGNRSQQGPLTIDELHQLWEEGTVDATTYAWNPSMGDWKRIADLPDLFQRLA